MYCNSIQALKAFIIMKTIALILISILTLAEANLSAYDKEQLLRRHNHVRKQLRGTNVKKMVGYYKSIL